MVLASSYSKSFGFSGLTTGSSFFLVDSEAYVMGAFTFLFALKAVGELSRTTELLFFLLSRSS
jgi:hypothetical protein